MRCAAMLVTITIICAALACTVQAETAVFYNQDDLINIFSVKNFNYINTSYAGVTYGVYHDATNDIPAYVGVMYKDVTRNTTFKLTIPIASSSQYFETELLLGRSSQITQAPTVPLTALMSAATVNSVTVERVDGTIDNANYTMVSAGRYKISYEGPAVYIVVDITLGNYSGSYVVFGLTQGTTIATGEVSANTSIANTLSMISQLIELDILPTIQNISNYNNLVQTQNQTVINQLNQSNSDYNNVISNYKNNTNITNEQSISQLQGVYESTLAGAAAAGSVEGAILANVQYLAKLEGLREEQLHRTADLYEDLVSDEEREMADEYLQMESEIIGQFDIAEFEAQVQYDTYYQRISASEIANIKLIFETILNHHIGQNFILVPLSFSIMAALLGVLISNRRSGDNNG